MRYSQLFGKTNKMAPADADSANARLLLQGGFVDQLAAGIYTYLPLGLRVLEKIKRIVREEMNVLGAQEVLMPALHPKALYEATGRWDTIDVMFKLEGAGGREYALSSTAEEVITPLVKAHAKSYRDFPLALYQIQDKFRNEPRAKSGLLRGREFSMKDLYSFHLDEADFLDYYERVKAAYLKVYRRCGLDAIVASASGGVFTQKHSHEFQVPTQAGEDLVYVDRKTGEAMNKEVVPESDWENTERYEIKKAIEVGNIFPLECRFSHAIDLKVAGEDGKLVDVIMGCYGIGPSRVLGSIVEVHHDERGIVWPKSVAPALVHIVSLNAKDPAMHERALEVAQHLHDELEAMGVEVIWDDRDASPGEKFADADLIGLPLRLVVSERNLRDGAIEWKRRSDAEGSLVKLEDVVEEVQAFVREVGGCPPEAGVPLAQKSEVGYAH